MRGIGRREVLVANGVAQESGVEEQPRVAEAEGTADLVLQEALLELIGGAGKRARHGARREGEVARDARVVPDAAVDRERLVEVGELLGAEAEAVLLRIAVVFFAVEIADADVDARLGDLEAETPVEVGVTRRERRNGNLPVRADDGYATLIAGCGERSSRERVRTRVRAGEQCRADAAV